MTEKKETTGADEIIAENDRIRKACAEGYIGLVPKDVLNKGRAKGYAMALRKYRVEIMNTVDEDGCPCYDSDIVARMKKELAALEEARLIEVKE